MDMKNTYKYIPAMLLAVAAISCNTLEKDEVEASFTPKGSLPTVSDVKLISVDEYAGEAVVEATFSGITSDMENLEIGFVASDEYSMSATTNKGSTYLVRRPKDGTYQGTVSVSAGVPNYIVAMAACDDGAVYSRKLSLDVPDVPWQYKVGSEYAGVVTNEKGDKEYNHSVTLSFSEDYSRLTVTGIDPYLRANYPDDAPNTATGNVDLVNRTVTFTCSTNGVNISSSPYFLYPIDRIEDDQYMRADALVLTFNDDASELHFAKFGLIGDGSLVEVYNEFTLEEN